MVCLALDVVTTKKPVQCQEKPLHYKPTPKTIYSKRVHQLRLMCFKGIYSNVLFFFFLGLYSVCESAALKLHEGFAARLYTNWPVVIFK